jgi:hypothetical protein
MEKLIFSGLSVSASFRLMETGEKAFIHLRRLSLSIIGLFSNILFSLDFSSDLR